MTGGGEGEEGDEEVGEGMIGMGRSGDKGMMSRRIRRQEEEERKKGGGRRRVKRRRSS